MTDTESTVLCRTGLPDAAYLVANVSALYSPELAAGCTSIYMSLKCPFSSSIPILYHSEKAWSVAELKEAGSEARIYISAPR